MEFSDDQEIEEIRDKEQRWQEMYRTVTNMKDRLGKKVDTGIIETVVVLNLLGMPTKMSCEGHLEWGIGAPWVDIEDRYARERSTEVQQMFQQAQQLQQQQAHMTDEIAHLLEEARKADREVRLLNLAASRKLLDYLIIFYEKRHVPFDVRLIIQIHAIGRSRLESQGADFQDVALLEERSLKLKEYQEEMRQFTLFLKQQYFQAANI